MHVEDTPSAKWVRTHLCETVALPRNGPTRTSEQDWRLKIEQTPFRKIILRSGTFVYPPVSYVHGVSSKQRTGKPHTIALAPLKKTLWSYRLQNGVALKWVEWVSYFEALRLNCFRAVFLCCLSDTCPLSAVYIDHRVLLSNINIMSRLVPIILIIYARALAFTN